MTRFTFFPNNGNRNGTKLMQKVGNVNISNIKLADVNVCLAPLVETLRTTTPPSTEQNHLDYMNMNSAFRVK